jgi:hypothetical protein
MPWKERSVIDERMRFVIRLKDGENMARGAIGSALLATLQTSG